MTALLALALALPAAAGPTKLRTITKTVTVQATLADVWRAWTTTEGAQEFLAPKANVQLMKNGPYELFFDPADERQSSKGEHILSFTPLESITFRWNAPPQFPEVRKTGTWVTVRLERVVSSKLEAPGPERVKVTLKNGGYKRGGEWDAARDYFDRAWGIVMQRLETRFTTGKPVDWSKAQ